MKYTYLIGNGFDLNYDLKTKYTDFYKYYFRENPNTDNLIMISIKQDINSWADFEKQLCTVYISSVQKGDEVAFLHNLDDVKISFNEYLRKVEEDFYKNEDPLLFEAFEITIKRLEHLLKKQSPISDHYGNRLYEDKDVSFIIFNYTSIAKTYAENTFTHRPTNNIHISSVHTVQIHGDLDNHMILGYGDKNLIIKSDSNGILNNIDVATAICKTQYLRSIPSDSLYKATNMIKNADIIVIYGMSLGESDSNWWEVIISEIITRSIYVIYYIHFNVADYSVDSKYDKQLVYYRGRRVEEVFSKITEYCTKYNLNLSTDQIDYVIDHFIIEDTNSIFNKSLCGMLFKS